MLHLAETHPTLLDEIARQLACESLTPRNELRVHKQGFVLLPNPAR
jgi:hypothetical protein